MTLFPQQLRAALVAAAPTALPFAEGILKKGWMELVLLAAVAWFLVASRARGVRDRRVRGPRNREPRNLERWLPVIQDDGNR
ncbi:MAG: hypothetical protein H0X01_03460 [Nitrospira sp.]|nr:hypothetical protein [Nitrospira sp.]